MRYFLIDKVTELVVGERIRGIKNVTLSEDLLHDHFPDHPIMPGALILEASAQLAGFLLETTFNRSDEPPYRSLLSMIRQAKFHATAGPGDQLDLRARIEATMETAARVQCEVHVADKRIATAELTFVMKQIDSERLHEHQRYIYRLWTKDLENPPPIR